MTKIKAFGTKLYKGTSSGTLYAQVKSFTGPDLTVDTIDVTTMDSTNGWEEFITGIKRSGTLAFEIEYDPADATHRNQAGGLLFDLNAGVAITVTFVFPDTATTEWTFSALVTGFTPNADHAGDLTASVTLKPTGDMTLV